MKKKALIAMSGGVDSSVAAAFMKEQGMDCMGVTMKLHGTIESTCCTSKDIEDAQAVCDHLEIPYEVVNFEDDFEQKVIRRFVHAYETGATPNPCIDCNRYLKFEKLFRYGQELGFDYVVTGHYARVSYDETTGRYLLQKALDPTKDQSYVLYSLTQEQLAHAKFPLGELTKGEVRAFAEGYAFINAEKADSQDICFVPDGDYAAFIERFTGKIYTCGDFIDRQGKKLGTHKGLIRYTIGQRKGLGIAYSEPLYVCDKDTDKNTVTLGSNQDLFTTTLIAKDINFISVPQLDAPMRVKARVRYHQPEQWATAVQLDADTLQLTFDQPQRAIAKGQAVVLYDGDVVVGGGTIQ